jgi:hypothetical protein
VASTNVSGNGANWQFAGVCPPQSVVQVNSGTFNLKSGTLQIN